MNLKLEAILTYVIKLSQNKTKNYSALLFDHGWLQNCDCGEMEIVDHMLKLYCIGLVLLLATHHTFFLLFNSSQVESAHLYSILFFLVFWDNFIFTVLASLELTIGSCQPQTYKQMLCLDLMHAKITFSVWSNHLRTIFIPFKDHTYTNTITFHLALPLKVPPQYHYTEDQVFYAWTWNNTLNQTIQTQIIR